MLFRSGFLALAAGSSYEAYPTGAPPEALNLFFALPPNIMRLAMLVLAAAVLVVASVRARSLLTRAVTETRNRVNLTRYLPRQVATRLAEGGLEELRRGRRQHVAVLFVDIRGFTGRSESMPPDRLGQFITEFRSRVARAVEHCGGTIDKFIGDAAMVVFGLVDTAQQPAADAVACAERILEEIAHWNEEDGRRGEDKVRVSIGVHWGEAFCGAIGDDSRLEYTVLGDTVNVAARLQELAKHSGYVILASGDALAAAGAAASGGDWDALEAAPLRGRSGAVSVFGLARARGEAGRGEPGRGQSGGE